MRYTRVKSRFSGISERVIEASFAQTIDCQSKFSEAEVLRKRNYIYYDTVANNEEH